MCPANADLRRTGPDRSFLMVSFKDAVGAAGVGLDFAGGLFQNAANAKIASKQMRFQKIMSDTAYQRSMRDMRLAGLNPILAYQKGGANTPPGAGIPAVNPAANSSAKMLQLAQLRNTDAQTDLANANSAKAAAETRRIDLDADRMQDVGDSVVGRQVDSFTKMIQSLSNSAREHRARERQRQINMGIIKDPAMGKRRAEGRRHSGVEQRGRGKSKSLRVTIDRHAGSR
ncbi:DNA pilot protein [Microviridae sp.]|nr:DNA pilot protein [Microviridae sp.]